MAGYIPQTYFFVVEASAILMHHVKLKQTLDLDHMQWKQRKGRAWERGTN